MKITFRHYNESDPIPLSYVSQIPAVSGIVSAVYDVRPGGVWSRESIAKIKENANRHNLSFEVVESVPVHEDIKLGKKSRIGYIDAYCENVRRLAEYGIKVICYNFMPVFDWLRSDLSYENPDGSRSLIYKQEQIDRLDPSKTKLSLPGWDESYTDDGLKALLSEYENVGHKELFENLSYFLRAVIPVCEEVGIKMAIHPDDPPRDVFGLPRIIKDEQTLDAMLSAYNSECNGITLCTGSLGADRKNDVPYLTEKYCRMNRTPFIHVRNIRLENECDFYETAHPTECGSLDIRRIMKILYDNGYDGYIRPDHGRMIWGETGKPGYGLYDRALGAMYLYGLWQGFGAN